MRHVSRLVAVLACLLFAAGAANAATVGISADAALYNVGDTITVTVSTDAASPRTPSPSSAAVAGSGTIVTATEAPGVAVPNENGISPPAPMVKVATPGASAVNVRVLPSPVPGSVGIPADNPSKAVFQPGRGAPSVHRERVAKLPGGVAEPLRISSSSLPCGRR